MILYGLFYLAREYSFKNDYINALKTAYSLYIRLTQNDINDDMRMLPCVYNMIGDFSLKLNKKDDAEYFYRKSINTEPTFRDGYIKLAQLLAYQPRFNEVYEIINAMDKNSVYREDWRVKPYYWRDWKKYQILADAKCWECKYEDAKKYFDLALTDIKNEDDKNDALYENFFQDYAFLMKKSPNKFI